MFKKNTGPVLRTDRGQSPSTGSTGSPRGSSGQSTVEYILLVTAVIAVMIFFTTNQNNGLQGKLNATLETASNGISDMSNRLSASRKESPISSDLPPAGLGVDVTNSFK